jgi:hypothetical protein
VEKVCNPFCILAPCFAYVVLVAFSFILDVEGGEMDVPESAENVLPLPDISQVLKKKEIELEKARIEEEKEDEKVRIKKTDRKAFLKV